VSWSRLALPVRGALVLTPCLGFCIAAPAAAESPPPASSQSTALDAPGKSSVPAPAFAQPPRLTGRTDYSSQYMAVELRFGPYAPRVDESQGVIGTPYKDFFGDKTRFQFGIEVDGQLYRVPHIGSLGVGGSWGYTRQSGANKLPDGETSDIPIQQESSLTIQPMYAVGVLRVDVLAREFHVPLVGYGKLGLAYALWSINNGNETAKNCDANGEHCVSGRGDSLGTQAALGVMLQLDWMEPSAAVELDTSMSINNSYLFFEWSVSNYGRDQMNVGSNSWVTGLAVEL
jgi:hypothetical protein